MTLLSPIIDNNPQNLVSQDWVYSSWNELLFVQILRVFPGGHIFPELAGAIFFSIYFPCGRAVHQNLWI